MDKQNNNNSSLLDFFLEKWDAQPMHLLFFSHWCTKIVSKVLFVGFFLGGGGGGGGGMGGERREGM